MILADKLRHLRGHITLAELAAETQLSVSFLSDMEHGRASPSLATLSKIGSAYGVSVVILLLGTEYDQPAVERVPAKYGVIVH